MSSKKEEGADDDHEYINPLKVNRRLIYFRRLVGDGVFTPKTTSGRRAPWQVVLVFIAYAIITTIWVMGRTQVSYIGAVNRGIQDQLRSMVWKIAAGGRRLRFDDVGNIDDVRDYIRYALVPSFLTPGAYSSSQCLMSYNRLLMNRGLCNNMSSLVITVRKVATQEEPEKSTSMRFNQLYPITWKSQSITAGSDATEGEMKDPLWASYFWSSIGTEVPIEKLGYLTKSENGRPFSKDIRMPGSEIWVNWKHTPACPSSPCEEPHGVGGQGGYIATVSLGYSGEHQTFANSIDANLMSAVQLDTIVSEQMVYLQDLDEHIYVNADLGACNGMKASNIMRLAEFLDVGFFDYTVSSVALQFEVYNANKQTLSAVEIVFDINAQGIVSNRLIKTSTFTLIRESNTALEIIYIVMTTYYFLHLIIYKLYKNRCELFSDFWFYIEAVSIFTSVVAFFIAQRAASDMDDFVKLDKIPTSDLITDRVATSKLFAIFASIAVLTIWVRIVQLLAKTPPRVKLLEMTLLKAGGAISIYISYIMVLQVGFVAFTFVHFSPFAQIYRDPFFAFVSCIEMLFLSTEPYANVGGAMFSQPFLYIYFMISIVSVQMFNAIINYSYNRASEDMEPIFKKAARERKGKDKQMQELKRLWHYCGKCKNACFSLCRSKKPEPKGESDDTGKEEAKEQSKSNQVKPAGKEAELDQTAKQKVDEYKEKNQIKAPNESGKVIFLYILFLISFSMFLLENLDVSNNGKIKHAISSHFKDYNLELLHASGRPYGMSLKDVRSLSEMGRWIVEALPELTHGRKSTPSIEGGAGATHAPDTSCINMWNCFFVGPLEGQGQQSESVTKMLRITQRVLKQEDNTGGLGPDTSDSQKFVMGESLMSKRSSSDPINPTTFDSKVEDNPEFNLDYNGSRFCVLTSDRGYRRLGGQVCFLDSDKQTMRMQLQKMSSRNYFSLQTGAIIIDMILYNANTNAMCYTRINFITEATGKVQSELKVFVVKLTQLKSFSAEDGTIDKVRKIMQTVWQKRLVWGVVYVCLVLVFIYLLLRDIHQEMDRNFRNEGQSYLQSLLEYFFDAFHCLDLFSMGISVFSFVIYVKWLSGQGKMEGSLSGPFPTLLSFAEEVGDDGSLYVRFSSINIMLAFWRILKYTRQVPQMGQLNQTFYEASQDTGWFLVMLTFFFFGFVFFAYFSFGTTLAEMESLTSTIMYCFSYLVGVFSFWPLWESSPFLAILFFFSYLFLFRFFFLNIFFAIIDRYFVSEDVPPVIYKKVFYPVLNRLCRWVEWKEDYRMKEKKFKEDSKPMTRSDRVHETAMAIQDIRDAAADGGPGVEVVKKSKLLNDVCDVDEYLNEVLRWSKDEANHFVETWKKLQQEKQAYNNDDSFLSMKLGGPNGEIAHELKKNRQAMEEAERSKRYQIQVHESMVRNDQETLARYIMRLEAKIEHKMIEKNALLTDVYHLRAESEKMRFSDEDIMQQQEGLVRNALAPAKEPAAITNGHAPEAAATPALKPVKEEADEDEEKSSSSSDEDDEDKEQAAKKKKGEMKLVIANAGRR